MFHMTRAIFFSFELSGCSAPTVSSLCVSGTSLDLFLICLIKPTLSEAPFDISVKRIRPNTDPACGPAFCSVRFSRDFSGLTMGACPGEAAGAREVSVLFTTAACADVTEQHGLGGAQMAGPRPLEEGV